MTETFTPGNLGHSVRWCAELLHRSELTDQAELGDYLLEQNPVNKRGLYAFVLMACPALMIEFDDTSEELLYNMDDPDVEKTVVLLDEVFHYAAEQMRKAAPDGQWMDEDIDDEDGEPLPPSEMAEYLALGAGLMAREAWEIGRGISTETNPDMHLRRRIVINETAAATSWAVRNWSLRRLAWLAEQDDPPYTLEAWTDAVYEYIYTRLDKAHAAAFEKED